VSVADEVLNSIIEHYRDSDPTSGERVKSARLLPDDVIEIVYSRPEVDYLIGLRVRVDASRDDEFARIVAGHLGEPLGSFADSLEFDDAGIGWWGGEPIEWWYT
jgi:hypothetical protein